VEVASLATATGALVVLAPSSAAIALSRRFLSAFSSDTILWVSKRFSYWVRAESGRRVENTVTIGSMKQFPKERDVWAEVERRHLTPNDGQNGIGRVTFRELVGNYRKKSFNKLAITTQQTTAHILNHYLLSRWGDSFALDIEPDHIEEWLGALALANPTK
jgi:hypothetical protein